LTQRQSDGLYELIVEGEDSYAYELGQNLSFRAQVLDANGKPVHLSLENVSSTISGTGYSQILPPTDHSAEWLIFTMRLPYKAKIVTALLFAVAALWLTELVPLAAGALLIPVVIVVASITDPSTVLQPFFHPIIVLFLAGFLLAEAIRRTGVDKIIALNILRRSSLKPAYLMITMMCLTAFLSMWMSNTASVAIIIPIALAVLEKIPGDIGKSGFRRALILGIAYAATVGGIGSAIGTPANILAMTFLNDFADADLGFIDWFYYGLPIVAIASSIDFALVVGTPPTMIAYSTGFFEAKGIFKRGIILDLIGILVLSFGVIWIWQLLGVATL
jgi:di/tricarboxylate transporter